MSEYFFTARSNAAPFVSDEWDGYVEGGTPEAAVEQAVGTLKHPAGLFAVEVWSSADAFKKGEKALAVWRSERAIKQKIGREERTS